MPVFDARTYPGDLLGLGSDLGARIHDLLSRQAIPVRAALGAIFRRIENAVSLPALRGAITDLKALLRREAPEIAADPEFAALSQRVAAHGCKDSIENYGEFLFTVDIAL